MVSKEQSKFNVLELLLALQLIGTWTSDAICFQFVISREIIYNIQEGAKSMWSVLTPAITLKMVRPQHA